MTQQMHSKSGTPTRIKFMLWCGVFAGPLFTVAMLLQPLLKPGFNAIQHPGSSLELGPYGWIQHANFIITGLLLLAFAFGVRYRMRQGNGFKKSWIFLAYWAIGLIAAGCFTTDPVNGYPLGTPNMVTRATWHGSLHDIFSVPAFILTALSFCFLFSKWFARQGRKKLAIYTTLSGVFALAAFTMAAAAFSGAALFLPYGGLLERLAAFTILGWLSVLAVYFLSSQQGITSIKKSSRK